MVGEKDIELSGYAGSLMGTAIGDSLGAQWEGSSEIQEIGYIGPRYTDDTAMTIGVAESLIACKGFNGEDMAGRFVENYEREPWRGYGWGPPVIFEMIRSGRRWDGMLDREIYPGGSFGNGAAMRVAPVGLFYSDEPEKLRVTAYESSKITHSSELAMEGAALQAYAVARALRVRPSHLNRHKFLGDLKRFVRVRAYQAKLDILEGLMDRDGDREEIVRKLGNGIEAMNSVPAAIYSFLSQHDFESSIVYAVSLGGDTDTIGAMTGAIAGAYYGIEGIPSGWKERVENGVEIERIADRLYNAKRS